MCVFDLKKLIEDLLKPRTNSLKIMLVPWWRAASFVVLWLFVETCAMPVKPADHGS